MRQSLLNSLASSVMWLQHHIQAKPCTFRLVNVEMIALASRQHLLSVMGLLDLLARCMSITLGLGSSRWTSCPENTDLEEIEGG